MILLNHTSTALADNNISHTAERSTLIFSTYLGRDGWDRGAGLTLTPTGDIILGGYTQSSSWPTGILRLTPQHGQDAYLTRLSPDATAVTVSYWFNALDGGAADDITAVGSDYTGAMYAVGSTRSSDFCAQLGTDIPGYDTNYTGDGDAFALKVTAEGTAVYCTYLGGSDLDTGQSLVVAPDGSLLLVGGTWSPDFPVTPSSADPTHNGTRDLFALKLNATGTAVDYATFWGGNNQEEAQSIALLPTGQALIGGWSNSNDFATTPNALQPTLSGSFDGFLLLLSPDGQTADTASLWGGPGEDRFTAVGVGPDSSLYLAGFHAPETTSFPVYDGLLTRLDSTATQVITTTHLGGTADDAITALAIDPTGDGRVWVTGYTRSADFPTNDDQTLQGDQDAFLVGYPPTLNDTAVSELWGGTDLEQGLALVVRNDGALIFTGETRSDDFPTTAGVIQPSRANTYDLFITAVEPHWPREANTLYLPLVHN